MPPSPTPSPFEYPPPSPEEPPVSPPAPNICAPCLTSAVPCETSFSAVPTTFWRSGTGPPLPAAKFPVDPLPPLSPAPPGAIRVPAEPEISKPAPFPTVAEPPPLGAPTLLVNEGATLPVPSKNECAAPANEGEPWNPPVAPEVPGVNRPVLAPGALHELPAAVPPPEYPPPPGAKLPPPPNEPPSMLIVACDTENVASATAWPA
jgi:hypothetical protein